jgi:hypothetical protein
MMEPLSADEILRIGEVGQNQRPLERSLTLLAAAHPFATPEKLTELSLGVRNASLFRLRAATLGPALEAYAECPECRTPLEFTIDTAELAPADSPEPPVGELYAEEFELRFRAVTSADLAVVAENADLGAARRLLAQRCVVEAQHEGSPVPPDLLPEPLVERLSEQLAQLDPGAECLLALTCPECGAGWEESLDIGNFFWSELRVQAKRLLLEVDRLARAYGWSEQAILEMTPKRRSSYLALSGD